MTGRTSMRCWCRPAQTRISKTVPGWTAARFYRADNTAPLNKATGGSESMQTTSADNMQTVKPTGGCVFFKAFGRLMHRIGHPRPITPCGSGLIYGWLGGITAADGALFRGEFTQDTVAELVKFLLAHTGLPRGYRKIDRWRRRHHKPHLNDLDSLTQEAVRLFFSHLDTTSLPPMSRAILYGSRARGDHRDDSDVDIMLVFAGAEPDYDTQVQVCNAMAAAQSQANAALQDRTGSDVVLLLAE